MISETKKTYYYIILTLGLSWLYQGLLFFFIKDINSDNFNNLALILMYFPGIIALAFTFFFKEPFKGLNWKIKQPINLLYSLLIPFVIIFLLIFLVSTLNLGTQTVIFTENNQLYFLDQTASSPLILILLLILNFTVSSLFTGLFTIGEEIGWRGYLQNKLIQKFGIIRGVIFLGIIWGYWHFPVILMGYNFPEYPILGAFVLMPLSTIAFSALLAWLTLTSKSIYPAIVAHGAINISLSGSITERIEMRSPLVLYGLLLILWLIVGIFALFKLKQDYDQGKITNLFFD